MQETRFLFQCKETRVLDPWVRKMPLRNKWQRTPVFLPEEFPWTEEPGGLQSIGLESPKGLKRLSRDILNCWTTVQNCVPSASPTWGKWKPQSKCSIPTVFHLISKLHLEKLHLGSFEKLVAYNFAGFWRRGNDRVTLPLASYSWLIILTSANTLQHVQQELYCLGKQGWNEKNMPQRYHFILWYHFSGIIFSSQFIFHWNNR